ncbi:MAG: hypothetical protein CBE49_000510 [Rickettsiales bacterium TMED289]|nr:MAG: hypothetical protein CBE49_000510 [Rickettsiales bacterium TMED289]|tara:strand:- start:2648 stop:3142 length:495 start_codon:yes stop_codon:yes gene_type:complete
MDFPDLTEYIGPIIFGLIAWLSSYFGNKKKPTEVNKKVGEKKEDTFTNQFNDFYEKIVEPENLDKDNVKPKILFNNKDSKGINEIQNSKMDDVMLNESNPEINQDIKSSTILSQKKMTANVQDSGKDEIKIKQKSVVKIRKRIKTKEGLKEAFILKEILNRKYD